MASRGHRPAVAQAEHSSVTVALGGFGDTNHVGEQWPASRRLIAQMFYRAIGKVANPMITFTMLLSEIRYRKLNFVLSLFAVTIAVGLFVASPMLLEAYQQETGSQVAQSRALVEELEQGVRRMERDMAEFERQTDAELARLADETRRTMRDLGFNLMIVHKDTNMSDFWAEDFASHDMPEEYVDILANDPRLTLVRHLVATLQQKITWQNRKVLLAGYRPEVPQPHLTPKSPMGPNIEPGTVHLGYELGIGHKEGETIEVLGRQFRIARILPEQGSKKDIMIAMHLKDAQQLLNKPGRINQIVALECQCAAENMAQIRAQFEQILPDTRVTEFRSRRLARAEQRRAVEEKRQRVLAEMQANLAERRRLLEERKALLAQLEASRARILGIMRTLTQVITPLVVVASAVWVGLLALANVRERRVEIGILRALGKGSVTIVLLFLGKAVLVGLLGGLVGLGLGYLTAQWFGQRALGVDVELLSLPQQLALAALLGAPLLSAVASYLPALSAAMQDPAVVLRDQ